MQSVQLVRNNSNNAAVLAAGMMRGNNNNEKPPVNRKVTTVGGEESGANKGAMNAMLDESDNGFKRIVGGDSLAVAGPAGARRDSAFVNPH